MSDIDPRDTVRIVEDHIARRGLRESFLNDPALHFQVTVLRDHLRLTHMAMMDEGLDPDVIDRVLRTVVYGALPGRADVDARMDVQRRFTEYAAADRRPFRVNLQ